MKFMNADLSLARELDAQDELRAFRDKFVIDQPFQISAGSLASVS